MGRAGKKKVKAVWPPAVQIWMERVDYDLETARAMLKAGRYLYVVFMCQQAVEKNVKAILRKEAKEYLIKTDRLVLWLTQKMKPSP